ncbi:DNA methyltransferase [Rubrivirga sp. S365]|uniref:DNA methyltransferase n=1 Tax=Rubrivirga sp. S365 TaxID=3076080 RepID=UPI0028C8E874|nr:DNA methyltransferase [Rubrivirga sp. S365]MDT7857749.1 DNA methyltransferase [Rubrivirga sp. S365]
MNARAAAIADLVLWIGYLQWHRARYGASQPLPEPVLEGYGQVEHRDAVLDDDGHPAPWPEADFVVGNPPFVGNKRMRDALGDDYTEGLRAAYPDVPESADLVMYWWHRAAEAVRRGEAERFGLITTNSLPQTFNRRVVEAHLSSFQVRPGTNPTPPLALAFAVPDHPWVDAADGAAVRVSMTVGASADAFDAGAGRLAVVTDERGGAGAADVDLTEYVGRVNVDLTVGADVSGAEPLSANEGISNRGVTPVGTGFRLSPDEAEVMGRGRGGDIDRHLRPYLNGSDVVRSPRGLYILDFLGLNEDEVRDRFPQAYEKLVRDVKPGRMEVRRASYREKWWVLGEPRASFRPALDGLRRFIVTPYVSKHRIFVFLDGEVLPDEALVCVALEDAFYLGILSSQVHVEWALAAGGRLGIGNDPRYNNSATFEPFPFPTPPADQEQEIRDLGEAIDAHRKRQQTEKSVGLTDLYNAVEALRAGRALSAREERASRDGLAHTLLDLHRRLDRAVLDAYGWGDLDAEAPTFRAAVLDRLVALNAERRAEEEAGRVRYLRPAFQAPDAAPQGGLDLAAAPPEAADAAPAARPWPAALAARTVAVRQAVAGGARTADAVAGRFDGARRADVAEVLDALAELGLVRSAGGAFSA